MGLDAACISISICIYVCIVKCRTLLFEWEYEEMATLNGHGENCLFERNCPLFGTIFFWLSMDAAIKQFMKSNYLAYLIYLRHAFKQQQKTRALPHSVLHGSNNTITITTTNDSSSSNSGRSCNCNWCYRYRMVNGEWLNCWRNQLKHQRSTNMQQEYVPISVYFIFSKLFFCAYTPLH